MPPDPGMELGPKGTIQTRWVPLARGEKPMVLTVPDIAIIDGPGYHMSYGEITKCATEGSVLIATDAPVKAEWAGSICDPNRSVLRLLTDLGSFTESHAAHSF